MNNSANLRKTPNFVGTETELIWEFLDFQRESVFTKLANLTDQQLLLNLAPSKITSAGMLQHLAFVESYWCWYFFAGYEFSAPFAGVDWKQQPDWDWETAVTKTKAELFALLREHINNSLQICSGVQLSQLSVREKRGQKISLRWIGFHLIEEYARHLGHLDLLIESIDGTTGI